MKKTEGKKGWKFDGIKVVRWWLQEMAVLSSTTACAAITSHTTSSSNVNSTGLPGAGSSESHGVSSLADKIHGLTEKLQALHHRSDSETSSRARTGIAAHYSFWFIRPCQQILPNFLSSEILSLSKTSFESDIYLLSISPRWRKKDFKKMKNVH